MYWFLGEAGNTMGFALFQVGVALKVITSHIQDFWDMSSLTWKQLSNFIILIGSSQSLFSAISPHQTTPRENITTAFSLILEHSNLQGIIP